MSATETTSPPLVRLLTAEDVAESTGVGKDRVWQLTREGKLRAVKLGPRTYRYHPDRVAADLEALEG